MTWPKSLRRKEEKGNCGPALQARTIRVRKTRDPNGEKEKRGSKDWRDDSS